MAPRPGKTAKVIIIQSILMHYRESFYEALLARMKERNVDVSLYYGRAEEGASYAIFARSAKFGTEFNRRRPFGRALWFPVVGEVLRADLVISEHSAKILINYILFVAQYLGGPKLVFWGHGRNFQTDNPDSFQERVKRFMGRHAHWYFAYTWRVRDELIAEGYDPNRVTDVQNAVEAPEPAAGAAGGETVRRELGLGDDAVVGLFCGRMYPRKRLDWLVAAAQRVHERMPEFRLVLAGAGESQGIAEAAAEEHDFIHYVGPLFGERKAMHFAAARFCVFSGLLGLGVVDAFHFGVPPVATDCSFHSPEIAYLVDGENGLVTEDSVEGLANGMIRIAQDDELHATLVAGCRDASQRLTVDAMADRYADGIVAALRAARLY